MRLVTRTHHRALLRDAVPLAAGMVVIGASFGAIAVSSGQPWWMPSLMSTLVFAGGAQFLAVGVIASGGGLLAAVVGALFLNVRHLPFGLAVGNAIAERWPLKLLGSHLLTDESTAFTLAQRPNQQRAAFYISAVAIFIAWNLGTLLGALAGGAITDPDVFGLDAVFPAALLAFVLPSLKDRAVLPAALLGAAIAVVTTPWLPGGIPVLLGLAGMLIAGKPSTKKRTQEEVTV